MYKQYMSARETRELYSQVIDILNEKGKKAAIDFYSAEREVTKKAAGELVAEMIDTDPARWKESARITVERTLIQMGYGIPQIEKEERESKKDRIRYELSSREKALKVESEDVVRSINWMVEKLQKLASKVEVANDPGDYKYLKQEISGSIWEDIHRQLSNLAGMAGELAVARELIELASDLAGHDISKCERDFEQDVL